MWRDADKVREFASADREQFIKGNISLELDPKAAQPYLRFDQAFNELQTEAVFHGLSATARNIEAGRLWVMGEPDWSCLSPHVVDGAVDLYTQRIEVTEDRRVIHPDKLAYEDVRFRRSEIFERWARLEPGKAELPNLPTWEISFHSAVACLAQNGKSLPGYQIEGTQLHREACALLADMLAKEECEAIGFDRETGDRTAISKEVWRAVADKERGYVVNVQPGIDEQTVYRLEPSVETRPPGTALYLPGDRSPRWEGIVVAYFGSRAMGLGDENPFEFSRLGLSYSSSTAGEYEKAPNSVDIEASAFAGEPYEAFVEDHTDIFKDHGVFGLRHPRFGRKGEVVDQLRVWFEKNWTGTGNEKRSRAQLYRDVDAMVNVFGKK